MQNKFLFYQAASQLAQGLSLADYQYRFYEDNAGKEILTVEIETPTDGQVLQYNSSSGRWENATASFSGPVTWGDLLGSTP